MKYIKKILLITNILYFSPYIRGNGFDNFCEGTKQDRRIQRQQELRHVSVLNQSACMDGKSSKKERPKSNKDLIVISVIVIIATACAFFSKSKKRV